MAHDINFTNGQASIMLADKPAWHDLGTVVDGAFRFSDVLSQVPSIDFTASKRQLSVFNSKTGQYEDIDAYAVFRDDNGIMLSRSSVTDQYEVVQVRDTFHMCDTLLECQDGAHYESAGVLGNGERFFVTARVPSLDFEVTEGDIHRTYLLFCSSHDCSLMLQGKLTTTRVVCNNTLTSALSGVGAALKIKHTKNVEYAIDKAQKLMQGTIQNAASLEKKFKMLATRKVEKRTMMNVLNSLFDVKVEDEVSTRKKNTIMDILDIYADNDGNAFPEQRGTAFNLLNAITNHTDHHRGVRQTKGRENQSENQLRADSALFGAGESFKQKAFNTILKETKNSPVISKPVYSIPQVMEATGESLLEGLLSI